MSDFTVEDYRQLQEALEPPSLLERVGHDHAKAYATIEDAARRWLARYQICDECGDGWIGHSIECVGWQIKVSEDVRHGGCKPHEACGGSGLLPNQETK